MFTGLVEELGLVTAIESRAEAAVLTLHGPIVTADARAGDSISVNGVCLTVVTPQRPTFSVDVMKETLQRSTLGGLAEGDVVNLERAATLSSRLGGHLVQGHVDGVGTVLARSQAPAWEDVRVAVPDGLTRYVVEKGSITIDGVSLTVVAVGDDWVDVSLIPTTLAATTLGSAPVGTPVNLEVDVIAKHVEKLLVGVRS